jgi:hypothetical protein
VSCVTAADPLAARARSAWHVSDKYITRNKANPEHPKSLNTQLNDKQYTWFNDLPMSALSLQGQRASTSSRLNKTQLDVARSLLNWCRRIDGHEADGFMMRTLCETKGGMNEKKEEKDTGFASEPAGP